MMNIDTLLAMGFIFELVDKAKNGAVAFSEAKQAKNASNWEKIVYDDRKPEQDDESDCTAYPVIHCYDRNYNVCKDKRIVAASYDSLINGLKVRYCVFKDPEDNFVKFSACDKEGWAVDYCIHEGGFCFCEY